MPHPAAGRFDPEGGIDMSAGSSNATPRAASKRRWLDLFGGRKPAARFDWSTDPWSLDRPLLHLGGGDAWTIRDACAGTQIFGDSGSGKTSGSGRAIATAMLRAGFGGLVLTVKPDETDLWRGYMRDTGRDDDLVVFSPEGPHRFNFLEHERSRPTRGGGQTGNLAELFLTAMRACDGGARERDAFWERAARQLLTNLIDALLLAGESVSIWRMRELLISAPMCAEDADDDLWKAESALYETLVTANERCLEPNSRDDLRVTHDYWMREYASVMDERTRGNIVSTFTTLADGFMRGALRELFSTELTIRPELTFEGKVIVLDLPIKQFHQMGRIAQIIWKECWQRAVESTPRPPGSRPVFQWIDEAQYFVSARDAEFAQTARQQLAASVYMTQSRANYLEKLGGGANSGVDSFLGVSKTKIFHCNGDPETNEWAQRVISEDWRYRASQSTPTQSPGTFNSAEDKKKSTGNTGSINVSRAREPRVLPSDFGSLRCGGPPDYAVQAIVFQSGRRFAGGEGNIARVTFTQKKEIQQ